MYKIVLSMSYYIHSGGLGALVDGLRPVFKESTDSAVNVLLLCPRGGSKDLGGAALSPS